MSKQIRVSDGVYIALQAFQEPRESYSDVIERLIKVYATIKDVSDALGPGRYLKSEEPPLPKPLPRGTPY